MNQTNNKSPPISGVCDHLNIGMELAAAALAEYREGRLEIAHRKVTEARDRLTIAEQILAHQVFLLGESG